MPARPGDKLLGAWVPPTFAASIDALAQAARLSRAELLRRSLTRIALGLAEGGDRGRDSDG